MKKEDILLKRSPISQWSRPYIDDIKKEQIKISITKHALKELRETSRVLGMKTSTFIEIAIMSAAPKSVLWANAENRLTKCRSEIIRVCYVKRNLNRKQKNPMKTLKGELEPLLKEALEGQLTKRELKRLFKFAEIEKDVEK